MSDPTETYRLSWSSSTPPSVLDFVRSQNIQDPAVILSLIKTDVDLRVAAGLPVVVDNYLTDLPASVDRAQARQIVVRGQRRRVMAAVQGKPLFSNALDAVRIIHLSDIHMFRTLVPQEQPPSPEQEGHDVALCRALCRFQTDLVAQGTPADSLHWIVSGDLTRTGHREEFRTARSLMMKSPAIALSPTSPLGLGVPPGRLVDCAGNHDHWDGWDEVGFQRLLFPPPARNPQLYPMVFPTQVVHSCTWQSTRQNFAVEIYTIDSNTGFPLGASNLLASGRIDPRDFEELERLLEFGLASHTGNECIRIIVCHHPLTERPQPGLLPAQPLNRLDVERLVQIAIRYRVAAILSGHTHHAHVLPIDREMWPGRIETVHEFRAPSALQRCERDSFRRGFWAHEIHRDLTGRFLWSARLVVECGDGFEHSERLGEFFEVPLT